MLGIIKKKKNPFLLVLLFNLVFLRALYLLRLVFWEVLFSSQGSFQYFRLPSLKVTSTGCY